MYTLKSDAGHIERMTSLAAFSDTTTRRLHMKPGRQAAAFAMDCVFTSVMVGTHANLVAPLMMICYRHWLKKCIFNLLHVKYIAK